MRMLDLRVAMWGQVVESALIPRRPAENLPYRGTVDLTVLGDRRHGKSYPLSFGGYLLESIRESFLGNSNTVLL